MVCFEGGLVDLEWDGQLKRYPVSKKMIEEYKQLYSKRILSPDQVKQEQEQEAFLKQEWLVFEFYLVLRDSILQLHQGLCMQ